MNVHYHQLQDKFLMTFSSHACYTITAAQAVIFSCIKPVLLRDVCFSQNVMFTVMMMKELNLI